jgi:hypothetical protein
LPAALRLSYEAPKEAIRCLVRAKKRVPLAGRSCAEIMQDGSKRLPLGEGARGQAVYTVHHERRICQHPAVLPAQGNRGDLAAGAIEHLG